MLPESAAVAVVVVDDKGKMRLGQGRLEGAEASRQGGAREGRGVDLLARQASALTEMGCSGMTSVRAADTGKKALSNQG